MRNYESDDANMFSDLVKSKIKRIKREVISKDVDTYRAMSEIENRNNTTKTILHAWAEEQNQDRELKKIYASRLLNMLGVEVLIATVLIVLDGCHVISAKEWTLNLFVSGIISQSMGVIYIIVKYLFPSSNNSIDQILRSVKHDEN